MDTFDDNLILKEIIPLENNFKVEIDRVKSKYFISSFKFI
jgi:hypothetical protein